MNILSLFDGISCGQLALRNLGLTDFTYYASEIDPVAIQITQRAFPNTIQLGDVTKLNGKDLPSIDLCFGGSPCQSLSFKRSEKSGLEEGASKLFWEYLRVLKETKPKYFMLENVSSMRQSDCDWISRELGVKPVEIDSGWFTAQRRARLYWTNLPVDPVSSRSTLRVKDILVEATDHKYLTWTPYVEKTIKVEEAKLTFYSRPIKIGTMRNGTGIDNQITSVYGKSNTLGTRSCGWYLINSNDLKSIRELHPLEWEKLQGLPECYTEGFSSYKRKHAIGNGWTVPVIQHVLKNFLN